MIVIYFIDCNIFQKFKLRPRDIIKFRNCIPRTCTTNISKPTDDEKERELERIAKNVGNIYFNFLIFRKSRSNQIHTFYKWFQTTALENKAFDYFFVTKFAKFISICIASFYFKHGYF